MSRPAQKRIEDLARQLDEARAGLIEARAIESAGTRETAAALANAEQVGICLTSEMAEAARVEKALQAQIEEREKSLKVLRAALVAAASQREVLEGAAAIEGERIVALRSKLEAERSEVAPLLARRARVLEKLERRISIIQAHKDARLAPKPEAVRKVLGFPQVAEARS